MDNNYEYSITKTVILTLLVAFCAALFFCYKVGSCSSAPENCKEEFIVYQNGYNAHCSPGARAEIVSVPTNGILCHCPGNAVPPVSSAK